MLLLDTDIHRRMPPTKGEVILNVVSLYVIHSVASGLSP